MATPTTVLVESKFLENTLERQYIATNLVASIDTIVATNISSSDVWVSVYLVPSGGTPGNSNLFTKTKVLKASQAYTFPEIAGQNLNDGDSIHARAQTASTVSFRVSGREYT